MLEGEEGDPRGGSPAEASLPDQGSPAPQTAGCWAGPTLKELCTRVSSRSMTTQILSESWALASGSRYWTGVCYGEGLGSVGAPPTQASLPSST